MIVRWSGREAHALRQAMRLSIDDFARHTEVSPRSVARWAQRGDRIRLRWDVQRLLDRVLAAAGPEVETRLAVLLSSQHDQPPSRSQADTLVGALLAPLSPAAASPGTPGRAGKPPLIQLERALARIHIAVQACRYAQAGTDLPDLIRLIASAGPPERREKLAADAYRLAADLLLKLDDLPMAMLAAQRAETAALNSGQPLSIAAASRTTVRVLTRCGRAAHATVVARTAAENLAAVTSLRGPRPQSGYGSLLLGGAVAHAACGRRTEALTLLGEASGLAKRLDEDANYGWTAFAPANVTLHRVSVLLSLGEPGSALHLAKQLDPQRLRLPERKAAWHLDTARACHTLGKRAEADAALQLAGGISPTETRSVAAELGLAAPACAASA